jgi:hypothetical protein
VIIEKGIPLEHTSGRKYLWAQMENNDSFFVPCDPGGVFSTRQSIYASAKRAGVKVSVRKMPGGLRVWRVT